MLPTVNRVLGQMGLKVVRSKELSLIYQHDVGSLDDYRRKQIAANKLKFGKVFADHVTLAAMADDILAHGLARNGLCHGARNGWEVEFLRERLHCPVIGTDISETADGVPNLVCHDFHEVRDDWLGQFSFIYTNSLDHSYDPEKALRAWTDQLTPDGRIYIEWTMRHSPAYAGREMDPFSAHPFVMPYKFFEWGRGKFTLADILHVDGIDHEWKDRAWLFVLTRT
jgi:SAM-dependent methyltransferase